MFTTEILKTITVNGVIIQDIIDSDVGIMNRAMI
jgi:hypothetical protein